MKLQNTLRLAAFAAVAAFSCLLAGHAQAQNSSSDRRAEGFSKLPAKAKIVVMPLDVELFSISAGGVMEPQAAWSQQATRYLGEALEKRTGAGGERFQIIKESTDEAIEELNHLHGAVATSIALHHLGQVKLPTKAGKLTWSLGPTVSAIAKDTSAQYALFTFVRDSYASSERKAAMVALALFGVGLSGGVQTGYASLVDLSDGRVVWFNRLSRASGDLREPVAAQDTLKALLTDFPE